MLPPHIDASQEGPNLTPCRLVKLTTVARPWKRIPFQPFRPKTKARVIPIENFDEPSRLPTEDEVVAIERALRSLFLHQSCKAMYLLPHIREPQPRKYPLIFS